MTTSHKPTFHPAVGSAHVGGYRRIAPSTGFSVRDLAAHTKLKFRQTGQNAPEDVHQRDLKRELEDRERSQRDKAHQEKRRAGLITDDDTSSSAGGDTQPKSEMMDFQRELARFDDRDDIEESSGDEGADAEDSKRAGGGSAAEESDSDDDEAELMRELERIKKEREEDRLRKQRDEEEKEAKERTDAVLRGNPLLNQASFKVKRRWDDDVVFKNQARDEPTLKKRFVNDTIRSDFHRNFLKKYVQ